MIRLSLGGIMRRSQPLQSILTLLLIAGGCTPPPPLPSEEPPQEVVCVVPESEGGSYLLVDTRRDTLSVMRDGRIEKSFENIAFGSAGAGRKRRRGDDITPQGRYRITEIRRSGKFGHFIALDYPSLEDAQRALNDKRITPATFELIRASHLQGKPPPQDTILGGHIGIHGVGKGDPKIHQFINWTSGCIALEDRQLIQLLPWIRCGMVVKIQ